MIKKLDKFVLFLYKKYGITPNMLTYTRIFAAPWLALCVSMAISGKNGIFVIFTLLFYIFIISTDFFDGLLARQILKRPAHHNDNLKVNEETHDRAYGGMLDRLSDKILIIFLLIPFGLNLFTFLIIGGESILAYEALPSPSHKKQATGAGKLKMLFQALLIPVLILSNTTNFIPGIVLYSVIILTIILTGNSIYSHYFND